MYPGGPQWIEKELLIQTILVQLVCFKWWVSKKNHQIPNNSTTTEAREKYA